MKPVKFSQLTKLLSLSLLAVLLLSACNFPLPGSRSSSTSTPSSMDETMESTTTSSSPTEEATAESNSGGGGGSCLVGNWTLSDFSSYFNSLSNMLPEGSDASITNNSVTGSTTFSFGADGVGTFTANDFTQSYTLSMNTNGTQLDIPMSIVINGTARMQYTVENDEISFHDQDYGDSTIDVTIMGNTSRIENSMLGEPGTIKLYKYQCVDANTLSLKVIAVDADLAPLTLTRVP